MKKVLITSGSGEWLSKIVNHGDVEERISLHVRKINSPGMCRCFLCPKDVSYNNRGIAALIEHLQTKKHREKSKALKDNTRIPGSTPLSDPLYGVDPAYKSAVNDQPKEKLKPLTPLQDRVDSLQAMTLAFTAENGLSLSTVPKLIAYAKAAAQDKPALDDLKMDRTTASYKLRDGLAPYLQAELLEELKTSPFSLNIDEATSKTNQRVLAVLVSYFSPSANDVIVHHLDAFLLTKVTAETLFEELDKLFTKFSLNWKNVVSILMDSCAVMRGSKADLETLIRERRAPQLLDIDGDSCHHAHNSAKAFCKPFAHHVEALLSDLHTEFKWSADLRDKLFDFCVVLGLKGTAPERYVPHRWLSVLDVAVDTLRLYDAFTLFFFSFFTMKDKDLYKDIIDDILLARNVSAAGRKTVLQIQEFLRKKWSNFTKEGKERTFRIVDKLFVQTIKTVAIFHVYSSVLPILKKYVLFFQKKEPIMHMLHSKQHELFNKFCSCFLTPECLQKPPKKITIEDKSHHLSLSCMFLPQKVKEIFKTNKTQKREFQQQLKSAYLQCAKTLQKKMPLDNTVLKVCSALDPEVRTSSTAQKYLQKLAHMTNDVKDGNKKVTEVPCIMDSEDVEDFCKEVQKFTSDPKFSNLVLTNVVRFWAEMDIKIYPLLTKVAKKLLSAFHGPAVESSFSTMAELLDAKNSREDISTYAAMQTIRYHLVAKGMSSIEYFSKKQPVSEPVPRGLCDSMRKAWCGNKKRKEENRQAESEKRATLGANHLHPLTKTAENSLLLTEAESARLRHSNCQPSAENPVKRKSMSPTVQVESSSPVKRIRLVEVEPENPTTQSSIEPVLTSQAPCVKHVQKTLFSFFK